MQPTASPWEEPEPCYARRQTWWPCCSLSAGAASGLRAALLYALISSSVTFANKAVSQAFDFRYPAFLLLIQVCHCIQARLGADVSIAKKDGYTTLMLASLSGQAP